MNVKEYTNKLIRAITRFNEDHNFSISIKEDNKEYYGYVFIKYDCGKIYFCNDDFISENLNDVIKEVIKRSKERKGKEKQKKIEKLAKEITGFNSCHLNENERKDLMIQGINNLLKDLEEME